MGRSPRDDAARSAHYRYKLIPDRVEDALNARLTGMQAAQANWAALQEQLYAIMAGVLSGYSVPSTSYARYYAFGLQVNRIMRKFGASPTATAEILNVENTWVGRGYNLVILDAIRDSISAFMAYWFVTPLHSPGYMSVNRISHLLATGSAYGTDNYITLLDPDSKAMVEVATTDPNPLSLIHCPELNRLYCLTSATPILYTLLEAATPVLTEQPLAGGDDPYDIAIDYDPAKWAAPVYGYAWVPCRGHAVLYKWRLDGTIAPTAITLAADAYCAVVDKIKNVVYVSAKGTPKIYVVNRDTNAIAVKTSPHNPKFMALDPITGKLWIGTDSGGGHFCMHMDTTTFAFNSVALPGDHALVKIDTIRGNVYAFCPTTSVINVINEATDVVTTIPVSAHLGDLVVDPAGCFLLWCDYDNGNAQRVHLVSLLTSNYVLGGAGYNLAIDPVNHKVFEANFDFMGGTFKSIYCINP